MRKQIIFIALALTTALTFSACGADVVGDIAVTSFDKIQGNAQVSKIGNQTTITSPTGNIFEYGSNGTAMKFPLEPLVKAGLDVNKLPTYAIVENGMMVIKQDYKADDFKSLVKKYREKINYHEALDHYGIDMGNGNKFEWAKDLEKNDKDIVFVLNPIPLKEAGVNVEKLEGFAYAEVEVKKGVKEFKLLAPYDLNSQTSQKEIITPSITPSSIVASNNATEAVPTASVAPKASVAPVVDKPQEQKIQPSIKATNETTPAQTVKPQVEFDGIVINKSEITSKANFISYTSGGVEMEMFAVKASDGGIRTAFNTCQVCYDSGRGYYVQQGDIFICQNCGNKFKVSDIEKIKGGCNPVPITKDLKVEDDTSIKISNSTLDQAKELFSNWKA